MAAAIMSHFAGPRVHVESGGAHIGANDPVVESVMEELGISIAHHRPKKLESLPLDSFDLIITLSPESHHKTLALTHDMDAKIEYWPTLDATVAGDGATDPERLKNAYRNVRDNLFQRIKTRFGFAGGPTV